MSLARLSFLFGWTFYMCGMPQAQFFNTSTDLPKVTILSSLSYQYVDIVPALHVAVDEANSLYSQRFETKVVAIYRKHLYSCEQMDDASLDLLSQYYYGDRKKNELVILVSPCKTKIISTTVDALVIHWRKFTPAHGCTCDI